MKKVVYTWVLLVMALLASCSSQGEYTNVLPKDAALVASIDVKSMVEKSGISGKNGEKALARLTEVMKSGLDGEAGRMAEKLLRRPGGSGLSFAHKLYVFVTPQSGAFALLAKVDNRRHVESMLETLHREQLCTDLKTENGIAWTQVGDVALCAVSDEAFLLMASGNGDASGLKGTLLALMRQQAGTGYAQTTDFAELQAASGEIAVVANMSFIPHELTMQLRMGMSADLRPEDLKYLLSASFVQGKVTVDVKALTDNRELVALYEKYSAATAPIRGTYLDAYPAGTLFWMGGNIDGKGIYDLLCLNPTIRQAMENPLLPIDLKRVFSSLQGDLALGYGSLVSNELLVYADVTNREFLQTFEDLRPLLALTGGQMQLNSIGTDSYEYRMHGQSIWFGVKNSRFYLSNSERLAAEAGRTYGASLGQTSWASEVTGGSRFFLSFNLAQLARELQSAPRLARRLGLGSEAAMLPALLAPCEYLTVSAPDWQTTQINLIMKDKGTNVLQLLVRGLENL